MSMPETGNEPKDYRSGADEPDTSDGVAGASTQTREPRTVIQRHQPSENGDDALALVYCTFPNLALARAAAGPLIAKRLAACVNILPGMTAIYEWEGHLHEEAEVVAIAKTRRGLVEAVFESIRIHHPHETPALLALDIQSSTAGYFAWVIAQTEKQS